MSNKLLLAGLLVTLSIGTLFLVKNSAKPSLRTSPDEFAAWLKKYNVRLADEEVYSYRRTVFYENKDFVEQLNKEDSGVLNTLNQFAIYTGEEFNSLFKGYKSQASNQITLTLTGDIAPSVDWRNEGVVTPVKNQGQCGSCWAFSAVGGLEGVYALQTGNLVSFSEQQLVDCSTKNSGCNGGDLPPAYKYVISNGIETEDNYPYTAVDGKCVYNSSESVFKPSSYVSVQTRHPDQLAIALNSQPVPICIEADRNVFQFYTSGIITKNCGAILDHCVLAVGYDADSWIVKNSWGQSWGENGYVRIARTSAIGTGVCGILKEPVYPIFKA